nr:ATP synthase F0 subunit 8 [Dynamostes audax]
MPQMAPLNWLTLFLLFILIFILFNTLNFFSLMYKPTSSKMKIKIPFNNWKW